MGEMLRYLAIVFGVAASLLIVLAVAVQYGYLPATEVSNLTPGELGVFGTLFIVAAVACEWAYQTQ